MCKLGDFTQIHSTESVWSGMRGTVKVAEYRRNREGIVLGMRTDGGGRLGASMGVLQLW